MNHFYFRLHVFLEMYSCPYIPLGSFEKDSFEDVGFCFYKKPCQRKYISLICSNTSFNFSLNVVVTSQGHILTTTQVLLNLFSKISFFHKPCNKKLVNLMDSEKSWKEFINIYYF